MPAMNETERHTAATIGRKGPWHITVTTLNGHRYHYNADTESDANLLAIAILAHGRDIAGTDVSYDPSRAQLYCMRNKTI